MADSINNVVQALLPLIVALEQIGVDYYIGGSVASSAYGESRPTLDADIVADIQNKQVPLLVGRLSDAYYIDAGMIRDAIRHRSSFNLIYLESMLKIDIFIPKINPFAQQERLRARPMIIEEGIRPFYFASPEDIILNKLAWYKMGDGVSTRQWTDILGVLNRQRDVLDCAYLRRWAAHLDVTILLERAFAEVDLQ